MIDAMDPAEGLLEADELSSMALHTSLTALDAAIRLASERNAKDAPRVAAIAHHVVEATRDLGASITAARNAMVGQPPASSVVRR